MARPESIDALLQRTRRLPWLVVLLALLFLAGAIVFTTRLLRDSLREQIAARDGLVLYAVALMHAEAVAEEWSDFGSIQDPANQFLVLLKTSRLNEVLAARLFDPSGRFVDCFPETVLEASLARHDLLPLTELKPISHFHKALPLDQLFLPEADLHADRDRYPPLLEVNVPLHDLQNQKLLGIAQFWIAGQSLARDLARLDRNLFLLGLATFLTAGTLLVVTLGSAFSRLRHTQRLLTERTRSLTEANQQLSLAAKTSAIGAVTAHLIHGLRNPLSGLQNFMNNLENSTQGNPADLDLQQAASSTRRMQSLINQVVQVLREQDGSHQYELSLGELLDIIARRVQPLAAQTGVVFNTQVFHDSFLSNRQANLLVLILTNLCQNALQATPKGGSTFLTAQAAPDKVHFEVRDEGPGFPKELLPSLFAPCHSSKDGGSGIGLAISKLLADYLNARLELQHHATKGCAFTLSVPLGLAGITPANVTPLAPLGASDPASNPLPQSASASALPHASPVNPPVPPDV